MASTVHPNGVLLSSAADAHPQTLAQPVADKERIVSIDVLLRPRRDSDCLGTRNWEQEQGAIRENGVPRVSLYGQV